MNQETMQALWLDETHVCSLTHLAEVSGLSAAELAELVDSGALIPATVEGGAPLFATRTVVVARTARRLRDDFELDLHGLSVALSLLQRIEALEHELGRLRARHG
jgi:chaperone modulatory protein CbpM